MRCSFVFPEAPLMVQATIIFLFRICLGVLINLLRIHYSIYQNNGTLLGNQREENDFASELNQWCFLIRFNSFQSVLRKVRLLVEMWPALHYLMLLGVSIGWTSFTLLSRRKCTVSRCCIVIRRRNREAFQVMTVLVSKQTLNVCSLKRLSALTIKSDQSDPD